MCFPCMPSVYQLEHEVEKVRETCRTLEATTARKEKVETAMRARLEKELRRTKEVNVKQKGIHTYTNDY